MLGIESIWKGAVVSRLARRSCSGLLLMAALSVPTAMVSASEPAQSKWVLERIDSPVREAEKLHLVLRADTPISKSNGDEIIPELMIRCVDGGLNGGLDLSIWWGLYLGLNRINVEQQYDGLLAQSAEWPLSAKGVHIGKWTQASAITFINSMYDHSSLTMTLRPYTGKPVQAAFNITGLETAIAPLREACDW